MTPFHPPNATGFQATEFPRIGFNSPTAAPRNFSSANTTPLGPCKFNPCISPGCRAEHRNGQHKPDVPGMERRKNFAAQNRCIAFHDSQRCGFQTCNRSHGSSNLEAAKQCPTVNTGVCEFFYKRGGCSIAHRA